ncbi:MAG: hypothetical protein SVS85_01640, partial [Candidatus Nanohaloarchaea archaeon]|nr:hypothetical protein [Candidatus Nanohaloarchaea archaeon]
GGEDRRTQAPASEDSGGERVRKLIDRFNRKMELEHEESFKVFLFIAKAVAAIGFIFVLGQISVTGSFSGTAGLILGLSAVLDVVPEVFTLRILRVLPERAARAERLQLFLRGIAYLLLLSIFLGLAVTVFWTYTAFMLLWLVSFLVEESVMFLVGETDSR